MLEGQVGRKVLHARSIRLGDILVNPGRSPEHAVELKPQEIGQVASPADDRAIPKRGVHKPRIVLSQAEAIAADELADSFRIVLEERRVKLLVERERLEGYKPDDQ